MSIQSYFMARFYDATMRKMEDACLRAWRSHLLADVAGDVLEIGSGTGGNLAYYPPACKRLVLAEPEPHMRKQLEARAADYEGACEVAVFGAEHVDYPDETFDAIVSTLVLCSVQSPRAALREIHRLLKPGGRLFFIEHVIAKDAPQLVKWQKFLQPCWIYMCGNCHPARDTERYILESGFEFEVLDKSWSSGGPRIISPSIRGIARKVVAG